MERKIKTRHFTLTKEPRTKIKELNDLKIPFKVIYTQSSCKIKIPSHYETYFKGAKGYTKKEFNAQKKLKKHIHENIVRLNLEVPDFPPSDIFYCQYSDFLLNELPLDSEMTENREFDITKAYYKMAFNLRYISEEMYNSYLNLSKEVRLRFLGSIATKKREYDYDNGEMIGEPTIVFDPLLRKVWFHICKVTDECLTELKKLAGSDFLMYYVDGIYFKKGDHYEIIKTISDKYNVEFKEEPVKEIKRSWDADAQSFKITITKWNEEKQEFQPKDFYLRRKAKFSGGGEYLKILAENNMEDE